jgi:hypothetical protein
MVQRLIRHAPGAVLTLFIVAYGTPSPAQTSQTGAAASPVASVSAKATCRVKSHAGGTTCNDHVTKAVCQAIALEASGTYTWTDTECP